MPAYGDFAPGSDEIIDYSEVLGCWGDEDIDAYREVLEAREDLELLGGYVMVELDDRTVEVLVNRARERGIEPARMASELLRKMLTEIE